MCGCTDDRACAAGCWWIDEEHTVCSTKLCADRFFQEQAVIFAAIFAGLSSSLFGSRNYPRN
jgi:hypothetical protein